MTDDHVALLGHPVAQSLSPRMQNAAFAARGLDWTYTAFDVDDAVEAVRALRTLGFAGANVTIPHKRASSPPATRRTATRSTRSSSATAACSGHNTDREILAGIDARRAPA